MTEERVTINLLNWLELNAWKIVCYDFPQSGTGILLRPNQENGAEKNKGGIIPDIIAVKNNLALFFENKNRFYELDFDKLNEIKTLGNFSHSLCQLLNDFDIKSIYYGVGIPNTEKEIRKAKAHLHKIDFLLCVDKEESVLIIYDSNTIFDDLLP